MVWRLIMGITAVCVCHGLAVYAASNAIAQDRPFVEEPLFDLLNAENLPLQVELPFNDSSEAELPPPDEGLRSTTPSLTVESSNNDAAPEPRDVMGFDLPTMEPVPTLELRNKSKFAEPFDGGGIDDDIEILPQETIRERYPDGQVKIERGVTQDDNDNYINHGRWRMYDAHGQLIVEGTYRFGKRHGKWSRLQLADESELFTTQPFEYFHEPFLSEAEFRDGNLNGSWSIRDGSDLKICDWNFIDGYRHGDSSWFYHNGRTMRVIQYRQGEIHGELSEWSINGDALTSVRYDHGRRLEKTTEMFDNGLKKLEGMLLKAKLIVRELDDWWETKLATYESEGKDEKHGQWTAWYVSGQMKFSGEYGWNQPVGKFTWWHPNGQKLLEGRYESGQKAGQWTWWHENGIKSIQGHYLSNSPVADWIWWHETGKVAQRVSFTASGGDPGRQISNSVQRFFRAPNRNDNRR